MALAFASPVNAATEGVDVVDNRFDPDRIEVNVEDTVVWTQQGSQSHSVTFEDGYDRPEGCSAIPLTCLNRKGQTVQRTFRQAGTFPYYCKFHGGRGGTGMSGEVVVKAKSGTPTTAAPGSATTTSRPGSVTTTSRAAVTTTSRPLSTSSTVLRSTTTTIPEVAFDVEPNEPPAFDPGDDGLPGQAGASSKKKSNSDTVAVIVALLLAVASGGGLLLWRLRPRRN
jgi:plastocyanin